MVREDPVLVLDECELCPGIQECRRNFEIHLHWSIRKIIRDVQIVDVDIDGCFHGIGKR